jgi:hypothetical protein
MSSSELRPKKRDRVAGLAMSPNDSEVGKRIFFALNNLRYKARTVYGLSKETDLPVSVVVDAIKSNPALMDAIKIYPYKSKEGVVLITTKERFREGSSFKDRFVDFFATRRAGMSDLTELSASGEPSSDDNDDDASRSIKTVRKGETR